MNEFQNICVSFFKLEQKQTHKNNLPQMSRRAYNQQIEVGIMLNFLDSMNEYQIPV